MSLRKEVSRSTRNQRGHPTFQRSSKGSSVRSARPSSFAAELIFLVVTSLASSLVWIAWAEETAPTPATASTQELAAQLLAKSNAERAAVGLGTLKTNAWARSISEGHSDAMALAKDIWHNKAYLAKGRKAMGAKFLGENVAVAGTIDRAHLALMNSPGHRANILRPKFNYVGYTVSIDDVGFLYATQDFAFIPDVPAAVAAAPAPVVAQAVVQVVRALSGTTASRRTAVTEQAPIAPEEQGPNRILLAIGGLLLLSVSGGLKWFAKVRPVRLASMHG